jgi:hypothetical protein
LRWKFLEQLVVGQFDKKRKTMDERELKLEILKLATQIVQPASDYEVVVTTASSPYEWFSNPNHKPQPGNTRKRE